MRNMRNISFGHPKKTIQPNFAFSHVEQSCGHYSFESIYISLFQIDEKATRRPKCHLHFLSMKRK